MFGAGRASAIFWNLEEKVTTVAPRKPAKSAVAMLRSVNPATGDSVGEVPITPVENIPAIVARARAAQRAWRTLGIDRRIELIHPLAQKLIDRADDLGRLLTDEMGKPLADAIGEVKHCGTSLDDMMAEIKSALQPQTLDGDKVQSVIHRDPFGVCAAISPWNFPIAMPHEMVIPALVAGNTVVLKPSEETPLIAQAYADLLNESLPPDVLQVIHGDEAQGKALVQADVDLIAFTGSREAGKHILAAAASGLKRVILELGGKDPMIVLDDADIEKAAEFAARNCFRNSGQVCVSTERIYVDEKIADRFEKSLADRAAALKVARGTEPDVNLGPMISRRQAESVLGKIDRAVRQGARVVAGGRGHHDAFVMPTILANLTSDMDIMREETFGPVACIVRVRSDDEAVAMANDTPFGLGATVFGGDPQRAECVARHLDAGMIGINKSCGGAPGSPWVGAKQSGYGYHSGPEGHRQFTQTRVVSSSKS
jgi:acyl-CoA reductase-like NAD-dependent aldehyde dehydrogenase